MPGCAAIGCNNRSEKGYSMKCFPRDSSLRKLWTEKVGRANWEPSKNSFLCHDHFDPSQWSKTENGKVRLRRDAVPSIFRETSTRKSPRKRRVDDSNTVNFTLINLPGVESEDDNNYTLEYLDDCQYEVALASSGSNTTLQNTVSNVVMKNKNAAQESKKNYGLAYRMLSEKGVKGLENENVIIVSDENDREIGKLIQNNESIIIVADENNKEIGQIVVEDNSNLINQRNLGIDVINQGDKYDEIERQLKQICDGEDVTVTLTNCKDQSGPTLGARKDIDKESQQLKQEYGDIRSGNLTRDSKRDEEIPGDMKIVFSDEDGETDSLQKCKLSAQNNGAAKNTMREKERHEEFEPIDNEFCDSPKIVKSPSKKRKRTEEDIMRSIEIAISELSEKSIRSVQNGQLTRSIMRLARARKKGDKKQWNTRKRSSQMINDTFELGDCISSPKKSKFTIKLTGVADDVSQIMEGLDSNRMKTENNGGENLSSNYIVPEILNGQNSIRIDRRFEENQERSIERILKSDGEFSSGIEGIDFAEGCIGEEEIDQKYERGNRNRTNNRKQKSRAIEMLFQRNKELSDTGESNTKNERKKLLEEENGRMKIEDPSSMLLKYFSKSQDSSGELRQKMNAQQEVIGKLTNQLIIYKGLEAKLANLNRQLRIKNNEIQVLRAKLEKKSQMAEQDESNCQTNGDNKEKTISDLINKVNRLKEANKKLMQQISTESQNKKLPHHLKQKDDQIKELNWKLEKASKYLDRAEKNANTYKRKMVNMQTAMRRQKAAEEKRHHFQELLIDNAKHEFSETALLTAMDIKNTCGIKCYQKLISYNFPLPSLRTLRRRFQKGNITEGDWADDRDQEAISNSENQNDQTNIENYESNEFSDTQVTGTVQDIFEENNETEELNSTEFGEHIFLQLNNDAKYITDM